MPRDTIKSKELQEYADIVCEIFGIRKVNIHVKDIGGGRCQYATRFISIPVWTYKSKYPKEYPLYYLLHEVAHIVDHDKNGQRRFQGRKAMAHDSVYKKIEEKILSLAGISITYKKAYPATLTANGVTEKIQDEIS